MSLDFIYLHADPYPASAKGGRVFFFLCKKVISQLNWLDLHICTIANGDL